MTRVRRFIPVLFLLIASLPFGGVAGAQTAECPAVDGITCDGWVTDTAGIIRDDANLERLIDGVINNYGHEIAVVIVQSADDPNGLAQEIGNTWGVGSSGADDGIVVLVALDQRITAVETGPGISLSDPDFIAGLGNSSFAAGDFDGGVSAIVAGLVATFSDTGGFPSSGGTDTGQDTDTPIEIPDFNPPPSLPNPGSGLGSLSPILGLMLIAGGFFVSSEFRKKNLLVSSARKRRQEAEVDTILEGLTPYGHELALRDELFELRPVEAPNAETLPVVSALEAVMDGQAGDHDALAAAWSAGLLEVLRADRVAAEREMPLELAITGEQQLLEDALQASVAETIATTHDDQFSLKSEELKQLVASLRPYRVAHERTRTARRLIHRAVTTPIGPVIVNDLGERVVQAGPVLVPGAPILDSVNEVDSAYVTAADKATRLKLIRDRLDENEARPAVSAALVDLEDDAEAALARYEGVLDTLEKSQLKQDGLSVPAVAAFLLMNNDSVDEFLAAYGEAKRLGNDAEMSVEFAMAGLRTESEIAEVRAQADSLNLPVAIAAALLDRGDRAIAAFHELTDGLAAQGLDTDTRKTVAALLAISLESSVALRKWTEAREALAKLGLAGAYADVAAAFGASDPRGPRAFAVAYAAQRQALARGGIEDADRYAPELAHSGTRRGRDSWTGDVIPGSLRSFDPFTLLYYRWIITGGTGHGHGWEPIYQDRSWSQ
ncbi:MAG: TPM domain-containing protein, partial [Acidimicrobiia bacterium]|nr:TPM domain-containing protein [Acidimicrobiia bacterium]